MQPPLGHEPDIDEPDDDDRKVGDGDWPELPRPLFRRDSPWIIVVLAFILTRLWMTAFGLVGVASDTPYYGGYAQLGIDAGKAVYRDFDVEYPPLAWWLMALPRVIDSKRYLDEKPSVETANAFFNWYIPVFRLELCVADIGCLALMVAIGRIVLSTAPWRLAVVYTLLPILQPHLLYDRLDIVLLLLMLAAIYCWLRSLAASPAGSGELSRAANRWEAASYWFLGLGISFKIIPIVFVPFLLLADLRALGSARKILGWVLLLLVAAVGPFLIYVPSAGWGVLSLFRYHSERGIHLESVWGSMLLVARSFGMPCEMINSHGSYDLTSAWSSALKTGSSIAMLAMAAALGLWALLRGKRFDRRLALDCAQLALINNTVFSHVFSPQYLNWLVPLALLLALNTFPRSRSIWCVFSLLIVVILGISGWLFPYHYEDFKLFESLPTTLSITRSACLVLLTLLLNVCFFTRYGLVPGRTGREVQGALAAAN